MRNRILVGASLMVTVGVILFWQLAGRASGPHMERYLPAGTLAFVEVADLSDQALRLVETKAWRIFSETYPELATGFLMSANYSGLLRASGAAALIRLEVDGGHLLPLVAVLAESDDEQFARSLHLFFSQRFEDGPSTVGQYHGVPLIVYGHHEGDPLYFARRDDLFVFSNRQEGLQGIIDVVAGTAASLADNPRVMEMRRRLGYADGFFGFVDGERLLEAIQALHRTHSTRRDPEAIAPDQLLRAYGLDSIAAMGGVSSFEGEGVAERLFLATPDGGAGIVRVMMSAPPLTDEILSIIPATANRVFVASLGDLLALYDEMYTATLQVMGSDGETKIDRLLAELGVDIRNELLAAIGHQMAVIALPSMKRDHPRAALIVEVLDARQVKAAIERMARAHHFTVIETSVADQPVLILNGERSGHSAHCAFVGEFLVVSGSRSAIETIIEAHRSGETMMVSAAYQRALADHDAPPVLTFYATNEHLLERMARVLNEGGLSEPRPAREMEALFPTSWTGTVESDGLRIEGMSPMGTFPHLLTELMAAVARIPESE